MLCEAPAEPRGYGGAVAQTVTQIAHAQLKSGFTVRYGKKMHVIHTRDRRKVLADAMAEASLAVDATLGRLSAEFGKFDLRR